MIQVWCSDFKIVSFLHLLLLITFTLNYNLCILMILCCLYASLFIMYFMLFYSISYTVLPFMLFLSLMTISDKMFSYIILWILVKFVSPVLFFCLENSPFYESWWEEAFLPLCRLKMPDNCFTGSGIWPGLSHLDIPILDFE